MTNDDFQVVQIDHVALTVPDRYEAAQWFQDVLGLEIREEYDLWADRGGPLVISGHDGHTMLALFAGTADESGPRHVAFRTDGTGFITFVDGLAASDRVDADGWDDVVDHDLAFSVYFEDPYGHRFEVTTYDYEHVAAER